MSRLLLNLQGWEGGELYASTERRDLKDLICKLGGWKQKSPGEKHLKTLAWVDKKNKDLQI